MTTAPSYDLRTFPAALEGSTDGGAGAPAPDAATSAWLRVEAQGFHEADPSPQALAESAGNVVADGRILTGAYVSDPLPGSFGADVPVATFAEFEQTVHVGGGRMLPAHLISSVTVRPTHRRRGLLRRMMTDSLERARERALPLAALTVSEATIYRRFGFGCATSVARIEVTTDATFRLLAAPGGRVELTDPHELVSIAPAVFERFHARSTGSVGRQARYPLRAAGLQTEQGGPDTRIRAAVHYDDDGVVDGYVSYRSLGWEHKPSTIQVVDLVAATDDAYLGLWELLAAIDLNERVRFDFAPIDDPLRWALADSRGVRVRGIDDWVWLRILDPIVALEARPYGVDDELVLRVVDDLGYAAGTFRIVAAGGSARVTREFDAAPDVELDAAALGSLYLGGVDARVLSAAGQVLALTDGAAARLQRLLAPATPVYGIAYF